MFVYSFPIIVRVPPHRYLRISFAETSLDLIIACIWAAASIWVTSYSKCASYQLISFKIVSIFSSYCGELMLSIFLGFGTMILYTIGFIMGVIDLQNNVEDDNSIMFAKGNWD
jgi:hypothetical protein